MENVTSEFDRLVAAGPPPAAEVLFDTVAVLGGSVAGLLAARVLADHARRVVVIERDAAGPGSRPGVPQGQQVHALLPGGLGWMERWLPGLTKEMQHGGAILADPGHAAAYLDGHQQVRTGDHDLLYASRPFMETRIRERVLAGPGVSVLPAQATGLEYRDGAVTGVRYRASGSGGDAGALAADFVVDAMGRGSRLADWLAADGYDRPPRQRVPGAVNYATALFRRIRRPEELPQWGAIARWGAPCRSTCASIRTWTRPRWSSSASRRWWSTPPGPCRPVATPPGWTLSAAPAYRKRSAASAGPWTRSCAPP